jgi:hypothetical protein
LSLSGNTPPDRLKKAQVTPLYKKNDLLVISNYRPVPIFSKLFEKVIETQLNDFFYSIQIFYSNLYYYSHV